MRTRNVAAGMIVAWAVLIAGTIPTLTALAADSIPGLKNPSIRIVFDETLKMPESGTMGWGATVFRVAPDPAISLAAVDKRIRGALEAGFGKKGFTFVEENPDYVVSYALAAGAEIDESELTQTYGDFLELPAAFTNKAETVYFKRGVLIVDVVERKTKHLMWRGAIMAEIDMALPEERKKERIDAVITSLMRLFPRPPK